MTKIKVKELIVLFDNAKYRKPMNLKVHDAKKNKYIMDCSFSSWNVVCCDVDSNVLRIECEV